MTDNSSSLARFVSRFSDCRVAVVGDLMLDRYIWGRATRISQEAPVPVVRTERKTQTPGGGANVVRNICGLGGRVAAFGIVGADPAGADLVRLLRESGAETTGIVQVPDRPTTLKTRIVAGNQQVCRVDLEKTEAVPSTALEQILEALRNDLDVNRCDAVILEDYAKGLLTPGFVERVVELCRGFAVPLALDPHPEHPFQVQGLRLMTPNRAEAFGLAGAYYRPGVAPLEQDRALLEVGNRLRRSWGVEILLITLGGNGMALFEGTAERPVHIPTQAREVFDVSGAGDTVMASFVMALAAGAQPVEAARLSNHAAGIVVGKIGTAAVTARELRERLAEDASLTGQRR
ncbi:MAG: hypothetical protein GXP31_16955 [Kiritimatiellaeota bacterium]|nr:hypothetical protein [Kiritimatiellota bacterium]